MSHIQILQVLNVGSKILPPKVEKDAAGTILGILLAVYMVFGRT